MSVIRSIAINPEYIKLRWQEPYVTAGLNRKFSGIIPPGLYRGFAVEAGPGTRQVTVTTQDPYGWGGDSSSYAQGNYDALSGYSIAVFQGQNNFQNTMDIASGGVSGSCTLDFTGYDSTDLYVVLDCQFNVGQWTTGQLKIVDASEIDAYPFLLVVAKLEVPGVGVPIASSHIVYDDTDYPRTLPYATLIKYGYMSPQHMSRLVGVENQAYSVLSGGGMVEHSLTVVGRMTWQGAINVQFIGTSATLAIPAGTIDLADDEVAYITLPEPLTSATVTLLKAPISTSTLRNRDKWWLFHRVGNVVDSRNGLQFEQGEKRQLEDIMIGNSLYFSEDDRIFFDGAQFNWYINNSLVGRITSIGHYIAINDVQALNGSISLIDVESRLSAIEAAILSAVTYDEFIDVSGVGGQQNFTPLPYNQTFSPTTKDLKVYVNGQKVIYQEDYLYTVSGVSGDIGVGVNFLYNIPQNGRVNFRLEKSMGGASDPETMSNVGTGFGVYKVKSGLEFLMRSIKAGSGINVSLVGDDIVISLAGGVAPYYVNYVSGQTGVLVNIGASYNMTTFKLGAYRNGLYMLNSLSAGGAIDRYQESTNVSVTLASTSTSSEVFAFVNEDVAPNRAIIAGISGTSLTVPSYTMGNNSLRLYRNGALMNASGIGSAVDQYTESSTTLVTLATAAVTTDVFTAWIGGSAPSWRENITGITGTTVNFSYSYTVGNQQLLVFRNGLLMFNSASLGGTMDRYQEATALSITLAQAATSGETFYAIYK